MNSEVKELRVTSAENSKRIMYLAKEFLLNSEVIDVVSGPWAAPVASRAAETLVKLNYVTYQDVKTETNITDGKRITKFIIRLKKTSEFKKLYDANEENRKKVIAEKEKEREKQKQNPTPGK